MLQPTPLLTFPPKRLLQHGLRTIAFCHTRKLCELVVAYVREMLRASAPALEGAISVYRGGYRCIFHEYSRGIPATSTFHAGYLRAQCCPVREILDPNRAQHARNSLFQ